MRAPVSTIVWNCCKSASSIAASAVSCSSQLKNVDDHERVAKVRRQMVDVAERNVGERLAHLVLELGEARRGERALR
jgi:hypothetical protein